ncbi:MAG: sulfotransferase domain-containing protein [Frankiaceae bacterium]|nr:sulfotransferase domain-containing protein [Frankiaceae bacterium]MBV9869174.1 sulfotransferase domain-containing protein [Frankiaceae bacterium]
MSKESTLPVPVKKVAQSVVVHGFGRATSRLRALPNLLIAGGQRCGTTSMYRALSQHPLAFKPNLHKGVHYFDVSYDKGLSWYRGHFPWQSAVDKVAKEFGVTPAVFESSPYYGFHPLSAERYAKDLPGVRLIVLIRDPIERAYSAHAHELARGYETEPFERALELEDSRLEGEEAKLVADPAYLSHAHQHQAYVRRGQYVENLERLAGVLGRDRIHIVDSERFFSEPEAVFAGVTEFLGIPGVDGIAFERHNARPRSPMSDEVRSRLDAHFAPYNERLVEWLGWTPSWLH